MRQMGESSRRPNRQSGALALADGTVFHGELFGDEASFDKGAVGEAVFNTSLYGYQEVMTDPSYAGQLISFTYPHIGNVGCNREDNESSNIHARGMIVRELNRTPSSFRAEMSLEQFLREYKVVGISGIDTRALTRKLRDCGAQMGAIGSVSQSNPRSALDELVDRAKAAGSMAGKEYVSHVSCNTPYAWNKVPWSAAPASSGSANTGYQDWKSAQVSEELLSHRPHVVALDCGVKYSILSLLVEAGFRVTVVPYSYTSEQIMAANPDALFLSNGPGDPATLEPIVKAVRECVGRMPIFGICLGHQILAQVFGGSTYKLPFGHRGGNHPVKDLTTGKTEITVQNHGFAVSADSLPKNIELTHINLNDGTVEGLAVPAERVFSVQYHPEASPGPHDSKYLFKTFFESVVTYA